MNKNLNRQFGATQLVDAVAYVRVFQGPAALRRLMATPQGVSGPAGEEQLR